MNTNTNISPGKPLLDTNLDTNFLKLIAIISMLIDHMGGVFFPEYPVFRWFGRLAFPIFCYCMTVGMLYTKNIRRYLGRLGLFAVISQPFWILAFNPQDILGNLTNWNIFFTLFISLLSVWGFKEKKWWLFILAFLVIALWNFDYSYTGIILMLIFYLCRRKPVLGACLYGGDPSLREITQALCRRAEVLNLAEQPGFEARYLSRIHFKKETKNDEISDY